MPTVSARIAAVALAAVAFFPYPQTAEAFGLNFGPLHLHLPMHGGHRHRHVARYLPIHGGHRHRHVARTEPRTAETPQPPQAATPEGPLPPAGPPSMLYPVLAWQAIYDEIFRPSTMSSWSFGYRNIFDQAFGRYPPQQRSADLCPYRDNTAEIAGRINEETSPDDKQKPLLQTLVTALGRANGYLIKACPQEIPAQPVARLQLMINQLDAMIMALEIVRPPLQEFEQALNDEQRARLDGSGAALDGIAPACKQRAGSPRQSLVELERAVQPTSAQREALAKVEDAFSRAQADLDADCPGVVARTALGRLEATEARLDAAWRAVQTIQVALADLQKSLSDEQNARLNSLQLASVR
jgi:hypothetical protein